MDAFLQCPRLDAEEFQHKCSCQLGSASRQISDKRRKKAEKGKMQIQSQGQMLERGSPPWGKPLQASGLAYFSLLKLWPHPSLFLSDDQWAECFWQCPRRTKNRSVNGIAQVLQVNGTVLLGIYQLRVDFKFSGQFNFFAMYHCNAAKQDKRQLVMEKLFKTKLINCKNNNENTS